MPMTWSSQAAVSQDVILPCIDKYYFDAAHTVLVAPIPSHPTPRADAPAVILIGAINGCRQVRIQAYMYLQYAWLWTTTWRIAPKT